MNVLVNTWASTSNVRIRDRSTLLGRVVGGDSENAEPRHGNGNICHILGRFHVLYHHHEAQAIYSDHLSGP